ncbi:MAG: CubicO group peptidase (beta-lactamase class C family) [Patiriisocius sp.]|jgi:CubicO group peptidase (beta-lactamase class C family)
MKKITLLYLVLSLPLLAISQIDKQIANIDNYMTQAIVDWNIPGAAIAIVKDGEIVFEKGYGVKNVETNDPVDENTIFAIASNTKAYTAAALAQLVDQDKLSWDDKVVKHLPYFKLYNDYVTEEFTVKDLLCHRSGLKTFSGDLLWYGSDYSRKQVIKKARFLEPNYGFRSGYGYQNIMFIAAGEIVSKVSGMSWDNYIKTNFLDPLGMSSTLTSIRDFKGSTNKSEPHNDIKGSNEKIDWVNWDNIGGAGALISSAHDAAQWLMLQADSGNLNGQEFWSIDRTQEMWSPQTPKKLSGWHRKNFPSKHFSAYGLGWDLFDYHGRLVVNHGGGYDGFISQSAVVPEEKLGFIIMTNNVNSLSYAMMYHILDAFLAPGDFESKDWGDMLLGYKKQGAKDDKANLKKIKKERIKGTKPSASMEDFAGYYEDKMYGGLSIKAREGILYFSFDHSNIFRGTFEHWQDDTFRLYWGTKMMLPPGMANFKVDENGKVIDLIIDVPNPDFDFTEFHFFKKTAKKKASLKHVKKQAK